MAKQFYYIMRGTREFKEKLKNGNIYVNKFDLLIEELDSKIGKEIEKKVKKMIKEKK